MPLHIIQEGIVLKKILVLAAFLAIFAGVLYYINRDIVKTVQVSADFAECAEEFSTNTIDRLNNNLKVLMSGMDIEEFGFEFYVSKDFRLMAESEFVKRFTSCAVLDYGNGKLLIMKGTAKIELEIGSDKAKINEYAVTELGTPVTLDDESGKVFIPLDSIAEDISYKVNYNLVDSAVDIVKLPGEEKLPVAYDMRDYGRVTPVRDQGKYGTCWAFASLGAFETTLLPKDTCIFSTDHMSMCNSYNLDLNLGGEHTMSIAYLAAWQGPVYEADDPYGDGMSDPNLKSVRHLEEALVINNRDADALKSAIFRYGGVETSLYSQLEYADGESEYYSPVHFTYYYDGEERPNHDVVVVGWDDTFSKDNFTKKPPGDGAWICKNSWGDAFGDKGYFYVSYYDVNICGKAVVYSRIADTDNFDKIYQSDLLGWVGVMGYNKEEAYFANVFTAGKSEELRAVSFYATDENTRFEVYVVRHFEDDKSLNNREYMVAGSMQYAGYYTVRLPEGVKLDDGERYAVVVKIVTPGAVYPIAIEYNSDDRTESFDISDGEGYTSLYGEVWHSAEEMQKCNVCLKAFTDIVEDEPEDAESETE